MKPLFNLSDLDKLSSTEKVPFECELCSKSFEIEVRWTKSNIKNQPGRLKYCSWECKSAAQITLISEPCGYCGNPAQRRPSQRSRSKSGKIFCSQSCAAKYGNSHKTTGTRRSKLEVWLEQELTKLFPNLEIIYNNIEIINSELDIYIPPLKLAFELNGIFHYEPIYGQDKLASIQNNDTRKFQAALEQNIELVIIDTSSLKYFKPSNAQKYLDIVINIIEIKFGASGRSSTCTPEGNGF